MIEGWKASSTKNCTARLKQLGCCGSPLRPFIGGSRGESEGGRNYRPVLRAEPTGSHTVSWAEFIEAGLLRQYRRVHQVPLPQLRRMIDILRDRWGAHPLVHEQPYVGPGRRLLVEAQDEAGVAPEYQLVAVVGGQLLLLPPAESFVEKVEWSRDSRCGGARMRTPIPLCA